MWANHHHALGGGSLSTTVQCLVRGSRTLYHSSADWAEAAKLVKAPLLRQRSSGTSGTWRIPHGPIVETPPQPPLLLIETDARNLPETKRSRSVPVLILGETSA
jgi:hypothetical protein